MPSTKIGTWMTICALVTAPCAWGQQQPTTQDLAGQLRTLKNDYERQERELRQAEERLRNLESLVRGRGAPGQVGPVAQAGADPTKPQGKPAPAGQEPVVKEPARSRSVEAIYQERGAVFEQKFTLEPSLTYSRFDRRLINLSGFLALDAIFLGSIDVQQTKSNLFTLDMTGRWGLTDRLQLDVNVPTIRRTTQFLSGGVGGASSTLSEFELSKTGLGDVSVGASYHLFRESGGIPDLIVNGRIKAPTGTEPYGIKITQPDPTNNNLNAPQALPTGSGLWAASLGVSAIKTVDPAILFANFGVIHNFARDFSDISTRVGVVQPGGVDLRSGITWGVGVGFAVNERMSMSFSFNQLLQQAARTRASGGPWQKVIGSDANAATFNFGLTYALGNKANLVTNVGVGLTPDAPDFSISVRVPYSF